MKRFTERFRDHSPDNARDDPAAAESPDPGTNHHKPSMTDKMTTYFKDGIQSGLQMGKSEISDAKKSLQKAAGLGHRPNVIPDGPSSVNGDPRRVELGWHPVAGGAGKWFADSIIGTAIQKRTKNYPDPSQHWAVLVGDYVHEQVRGTLSTLEAITDSHIRFYRLWMDDNLDIIYINEKLNRDEWHTFEVGKTRFTDQALRKASRMTIHNMREKKAAYNLITNNCQNFAVNLLGNVQVGAHREFGTAFAVYQRVTGEGNINDLWGNTPAEDQPQNLQQDEEHHTKAKRQENVNLAQQVMNDNTTKLDTDHD